MCRDDNIADSTLRSHTRGEYFTVNYYLPHHLSPSSSPLILFHMIMIHEILSAFSDGLSVLICVCRTK